MACSGGFCNNFGTGTSTCSGHRGSCGSNRQLSSSGDFAVQGGRVRRSDIEDLRQKIRAELSAYNAHVWYNYTLRQPSPISVGQDITDNEVEDLNQMVTDVYGGVPLTDRNGLPIDDNDWGPNIRDKYNVIRQNCICNSDCSCNNICSCHNNCGCFY